MSAEDAVAFGGAGSIGAQVARWERDLEAKVAWELGLSFGKAMMRPNGWEIWKAKEREIIDRLHATALRMDAVRNTDPSDCLMHRPL